MGASGLLESKNDHLIDELLVDPNYKIKDGKIFTKLTLNGQGVSDDWREVGYQKADGYVRFRYKGEFLFAQRVIYQHKNKDIKSDMVINHINLNNSDNNPDNLEQLTQHQNNKKKHKKYKKHKKSFIQDIIKKIAGDYMFKSAAERVLNTFIDEKYKTSDDHSFHTSIEIDIDQGLILAKAKIKKEDFDGLETKQVKIAWKDVITYRQWGLEVLPVVQDQKIEIEYRFITNEDGDTEVKTLELDLKSIDVEYSSHKESGGSYSITPTQIDIDKKGKAKVTFSH